MKRFFALLGLLILAACTSPSASPEATASPLVTMTMPQILAPLDGSEFVESDLWLDWEWPNLAAGQLFVLRFWYGTEAPQEIWLAEKRLNAQSLIDSYSRDLGDYHWQVALVKTNAEGGFEAMASEWTPVQNLHRVRRLSLTPLPLEQMSPTARFIAEQGFATATELIDFTRNWMFTNTLIGEELSGYAPDYSDAAQLMYEHSLGNGEAPQMYCNGISTTMLTVLYELGIESRLVFLYGETEGWISEHTVLEVFNPDSQAWEVHDTTNNFYFIDSINQTRIALSRMVFGSLDTIEGCNQEGCSAENGLAFLRPRLGAFRYGYSTELWVNPDLFNMSRRVEAFDNANFAEFIAKEAGVPVQELTFHFDSRR